MLYLIAVLTYVIAHDSIPPLNTNSEYFRLFYKRGEFYDTTYISLANYTYYSLMNIYGFIYVNLSNMNCSRKSVFHSSYSNTWDFVQTLLWTPICFLIGVISCM